MIVKKMRGYNHLAYAAKKRFVIYLLFEILKTEIYYSLLVAPA